MGVTTKDQDVGLGYDAMPTDDEIEQDLEIEEGISDELGAPDTSGIESEIEQAKEKVTGKPPEEPKEPDEAPPEGKDSHLDQLNSLVDGDFALAEVVFNVGHYQDEYGSPASLADVAFEITETDESVHKAVMEAYQAGEDTAKEFLSQAIEQGLVKEGEEGGYVITDEGKSFLEQNQDKLGHTYESKKHGKDISGEAKEPSEPSEPTEPEPSEPPEDLEPPEEPPEEPEPQD